MDEIGLFEAPPAAPVDRHDVAVLRRDALPCAKAGADIARTAAVRRRRLIEASYGIIRSLMRAFCHLFSALLAAIYATLSPVEAVREPPQPRANVVVVFETAKGNIEIEVDAAHAPLSAANFLKYVDGGFYDGGAVNRAVRPDNTVRHDVEIQVIQFQMARGGSPSNFRPCRSSGPA